MSDDPYVYPGTDVLRNLRGIRDGSELEEFETRLTYLRGLQVASDPPVGKYDLSHLRGFHRYLFAGLYEWAGELRTVVLAKTDAADAGYRLDWQFVDPQDNIDASVATMQGNEAPMRDLLDKITKPLA